MKAKVYQNWTTLLWASIIGGRLSGIVKLGWEVMFPPRTPMRRNESSATITSIVRHTF